MSWLTRHFSLANPAWLWGNKMFDLGFVVYFPLVGPPAVVDRLLVSEVEVPSRLLNVFDAPQLLLYEEGIGRWKYKLVISK